MSEPVQGFSPLQRDLADRIWSMDTQDQVQQFINTLPRSLKREAWVVMNMIIWSELDQVQDVDPSVNLYLASL